MQKYSFMKKNDIYFFALTIEATTVKLPSSVSQHGKDVCCQRFKLLQERLSRI